MEDALNCSLRIRNQLDFTGIMYAHLAASTPALHVEQKKAKGNFQRNRALDHIEALHGPDGVVYFGDDDNAYDMRLFNELRKTKRVGIFTVGFRGKSLYERCIVNSTTGKVGKIVPSDARKFPIDMGGFAVHTSVIKSIKPRFQGRSGHAETEFLEQLVDSVTELEPLNLNCTRIYSWHVKTGGMIINRVNEDPDFEQIKGLV